jgi:hypothetical protein
MPACGADVAQQQWQSDPLLQHWAGGAVGESRQSMLAWWGKPMGAVSPELGSGQQWTAQGVWNVTRVLVHAGGTHRTGGDSYLGQELYSCVQLSVAVVLEGMQAKSCIS